MWLDSANDCVHVFSARLIQRAFVDMENMLDIMAEEPDVTDDADAGQLQITNAEIEFENVTFAYHPQ